jgi:hypothetical protein
VEADWLRRVQEPDCHWHEKRPGATDEEISALRAFFRQPLPEDYEVFLRFANGARISGNDDWYVRIWASYDLPTWGEAYAFFSDDIPGTMPIADDGGDECMVFDLRHELESQHYAIYEIPFTAISWDYARFKAPTFSQCLLQQLRLT